MISFLSGIYMSGFIATFIIISFILKLGGESHTRFLFYAEIILKSVFWPVLLIITIINWNKRR